MTVEEIALTMGQIGSGEWELHLEDGGSVHGFFDEIEVSKQSGFHDEGWDENQAILYELTTGKRPGGPVRLRRRALDEEGWEEAGRVVEAIGWD